MALQQLNRIRQPRFAALLMMMTLTLTWLPALPVAAADFEVVVTPRTSASTTPALLRQPQVVELMLDDDSSENDLGLVAFNGAARQFLWCNQFTPAVSPFQLEQIWVLFPPGDNMAVGNAVQLVVYLDPDGNPSNGASLLASYNETIQAVDGTTFSVYNLDPPLQITGAGDVLIGVVNRWVVSGVTSTTYPATIDTTSSLGRSWLGVWSGDPPATPSLPADGLFDLVDRFEPGNWMIRGLGTGEQVQPPQPAIPMLAPTGLALMVVLLLLTGVIVVRRH